MELSYFGKLSSRGDFVRYNAANPAFRAFDEWIQTGLRFMASRPPSEFSEAYLSAGRSSFVFQPRDSALAIAGSIRPSSDAAGRKYPFFVAALMEGASFRDVSASMIPLSGGHFFDVVGSIVDAAVESANDSAAGTEQLDLAMRDSETLSFGQTGEMHEIQHVFSGVSVEHFSTAIWETFFDSRKYAAFKHLLDVLLPWKGRGQPRLSYGLQFPLATGPLLATSVSFWLEACSRLLALPEMTPTLFWNATGGKNGHRPELVVHFSNPPPAGFASLLQTEILHDSLFAIDVIGSQNAAELAISIPEKVGRLIESKDASLWDLVQGLD